MSPRTRRIWTQLGIPVEDDVVRWSPGLSTEAHNPQECFTDKTSTKDNTSEHLSIRGSSSYNPGDGGGEQRKKGMTQAPGPDPE